MGEKRHQVLPVPVLPYHELPKQGRERGGNIKKQSSNGKPKGFRILEVGTEEVRGKVSALTRHVTTLIWASEIPVQGHRLLAKVGMVDLSWDRTQKDIPIARALLQEALLEQFMQHPL